MDMTMETQPPITNAIDQTRTVANQLADRLTALRGCNQEDVRVSQVRVLIADAQRALAIVDSDLVDLAASLPPEG